jgi:5-methylcytosine-specific restriction endonuclease McrA
LEVHHIVPLSTIGYRPEFSAYHLPWNLVALCHECHLEIHAIMRPPAVTSQTKYDRAISAGQISFLERR